MPLPLLLAMVLAFGMNLPTVARPLSRAEIFSGLIETAGGVFLIGLIALVLGELVALRAAQRGRSSSARGLLSWGSRGIVGLGLGVFAWTLFVADWHRVVDWGLGLRNVMVIEEFAVILPFLAGQFLAWCGAYRAERILRPSVASSGLWAFLSRRCRHSMGMVLPVALMYLVGRDLLRWASPKLWEEPAVQLAGMAGIGALIFLCSPAFVRLTWPTKRLEPGPLRDRLDFLAKRLKFRCSDILVWDTDGNMVNAGVTGTIPWFRYVLITDGMIDHLDDHEIEAVFGHEVGHVAHRHLVFFGLFFLGSIGFMTLVSMGAERYQLIDKLLGQLNLSASTANLCEEGFSLVFFGLYFFLIFGLISRRFERQADIYGSRAVSCGSENCPPHRDPNLPLAESQPIAGLCPVGIRIFANALAHVAELNGMAREARSWRHGSIARRIRFLEKLESEPRTERSFQNQVKVMRWTFACILLLASSAAIYLSQTPTGK